MAHRTCPCQPQYSRDIESPSRPRYPTYEAALLSLLSSAAKKQRSSGPGAESLALVPLQWQLMLQVREQKSM
jgi:hypothetical protein